MIQSIPPDTSADSEFTLWVEGYDCLERSHSNIIGINAPDEPDGLRVWLNDSVDSYFIGLCREHIQLMRTVINNRETVSQVVVELAAAASDLREPDERPERIDRVKIGTERGSPPTPNEWSD